MDTIERLTWWIWEASLTASWAMLIALPLLLVFRKPAFAQARYWIGLLVLARLLFPFSFQSELSVQNYVPSAEAAVEVAYELPTYIVEPSPKPNRILPLISLVGTLALAARVFFQQWRVRSWIRAGELVNLRALDEARLLMPVRRKIAVYVVPQIATPALCGLFRPKLLLPPNVLANENLRMVFLHELAHVRRWDVLAKWAMIAARTLHWFNPLVWLVTRRMEADQELLCDSAALRALNRDEQKRYGEALLALASDTRPASATLLPISGNFKQMKERIGMITQFKPSTRRNVLLAAAVAAVFSFLAFTRAVEKEAPTTSKQQGVITAEKPKSQPTEKTLQALREEFEKLTSRIESRERELDAYRDKLGITGPLTNEDALPANDNISRLEEARIQSQQTLFEVRGKLTIFQDAKVPKAGLVYISSDPVLTSMFSAREDTEQQIAAVSVDSGAEHPDMKRLTARLKKLNEQIQTRVEGLHTGLKMQASTYEKRIPEIEDAIAKARAQDAELRREARPYFNAKRDIETMRAVRDSLHARLLQTEIEARVAKAGE